MKQIIRLLCLLAATGVAFAQPASERNYQLSDKVSEELGKFQTAYNEKKWDAALGILDTLIAKSEPGSFDVALMEQYRAQILLQQNLYSKAIDPLEKAVTLSDAKFPTYFEERVTNELVYYLAQLYFQEATTTKNNVLQVSYYDKAEKYMARWVKNTKKPNPDALLFYSSLLYNRAVQDAENVDNDRIKKALDQADVGLRLVARPKDSLYVLKLACLQQLSRNGEAAELLELLVKQKPDNKNYWQQLAAIYLNQQQDVRAVLTFERAQSFGHMNAPKDNFNLVGILFNMGQYERSAELLEKGLKDGTLDNDLKNWELLSFSYQQLNREEKAIDALKRASEKFPKAGQLDYLIAQMYYGALEKPLQAIEHLQKAISKDGGNKPHQTYLFLAYVAYEQKQFELALDAAKKAVAIPEGAKEGERMLKAIEDAIKERTEKIKA
jgi:tetratricopeptide (TPR) repeat protein